MGTESHVFVAKLFVPVFSRLLRAVTDMGSPVRRVAIPLTLHPPAMNSTGRGGTPIQRRPLPNGSSQVQADDMTCRTSNAWLVEGYQFSLSSHTQNIETLS